MSKNYKNLCKEVFSNDHLVEKILLYLDLSEQIKLVKISKRFQHILTNTVWSKSYTGIQLYRTKYVNMISKIRKTKTGSEEVRNFKVVLRHKECEKFLILNAENIETLKVCSEYFMLKRDISTVITDIQIYKNLKYFICYRLIIKDEFMRNLSANCKNLRSIHLLKCCDENFHPLVPGENLCLKSLHEMENLEELVIRHEYAATLVIDSLNFQELLESFNLRSLILENITLKASDFVKMENCNKTLFALNMGLITPSFWSQFSNYSDYMENLQELYIKSKEYSINFNLQILYILSTKCHNLKSLTLGNCNLEINDFRVLKQLKLLSLDSCEGLTFVNLQEIMGGLQLSSLSLINTPINGEINHIYISPSLKEITIDSKDFTQMSHIFQMSLQKFESLHSLKWLNGEIKDTWLIEKCPNLRHLCMPFTNSLKIFIIKMKYLIELTFYSSEKLTWNFILSIIQYLKLERFHLETEDLIKNCIVPDDTCGIKTTLREILMPLHIFKAAESFWLDLLVLNQKLSYVIYGKWYLLLDFDWLEELIYSDIFGEGRVKFIRICGVEFDCLDMKKDFNLAIQNINKYTSYYRYKNANFTLEM
ncbi:uncharacterized protein ACRADG_002518 isoform 2-T2 [Cochliomyia hominivorax]